jgi:hypothetical protein
MVYPIVKKVGLGISRMGYCRGVMVTCAGDSFDESESIADKSAAMCAEKPEDGWLFNK